MGVVSTFQEFCHCVDQGFNVVPVKRVVLADLETPVSLYLKLRDKNPSFLLESVEGGENLGRYSTVGVNPRASFQVTSSNNMVFEVYDTDFQVPQISSGDVFSTLEELLRQYCSPLGEFSGIVGALSYDSVRFLEPVDLAVSDNHSDATFLFAGEIVVFDHLRKHLELVSNVYINSSQDLKEQYDKAIQRLDDLQHKINQPLQKGVLCCLDSINGVERECIEDWSSNFSAEQFQDTVRYLKKRIQAGDIFQIVLSQRFQASVAGSLDSLTVYRLLRHLNPSPYLFLLDFKEFQLVGSSPEVMVKSTISEDSYTAILRPIAGTYRRGESESIDLERAAALREDPKEVAEHLMLVDLARNDLGRIAVPGTVRPHGEMMFVEKYSHVLHLVSEIICDVKPDTPSISLIKAVFPAGTLSGAPKVKAMQILSEVESVPRSYYAGLCGFLGFDNSCNTCMTIRTMFIKPLMDSTEITIQAGAGIVYDSIPESEYQETINKAAALLKVVERARSV